MFLFFFFLSQTRGAFIGIMLGAFVFLLYLLFGERRPSGNGQAQYSYSSYFLAALALRYGTRSSSRTFPEGRLLSISLSDAYRADPFVGLGCGVAGIP